MENTDTDVETGGLLARKRSLSLISRLRNMYRAARRRGFVTFQLGRIGDMTLMKLLEDPIASILLRKYLINEYPQHEVEVRAQWDCYLLCKQIFWNIKLLKDPEIVDKLLKVCKPVLWENEIMRMANEAENPLMAKRICLQINKLMMENIVEIETNEGYFSFVADVTFHRDKIIKYLEQIYNDKEYIQRNEAFSNFDI